MVLSRAHRFVLPLGWLTLFLMGTDVFVISPILPLIARSYGVTSATAGLGMTVFALAYAALAPVFGHYGDRHGRRAPMVGGLLTLAVGNAATAAAPSFGLFLFARFIAGGAAAAITPTVYSVTGDVAPPERRGAWLAIVGSGIFTALWSSAPLGALLGYRVGWKTIFVILTAVPLALAAANYLAMADLPHESRAHAGSLRGLLGDVSLTTLWSAALYGTYTFLGAGLREAVAATPTQISIAVAVYGVGMVTGGLSGGFLVDRLGARRVSTVSCLVVAAAALAFRQALGVFSASMAALFCFSYGAALFFPAFQVHLAHRHAARRGAALAWNNSALYAGITLGSFIGSRVFAAGGFYAVPFVSVGFAAAALAWSRALPWEMGDARPTRAPVRA